MALVVFNAKEKKGEYEGNRYHNIVITAFDDTSTNKQLLFGPDVETIKIKADNFAEALKRNNERGFKNVRDLEGSVIHPYYDRYGNCIDFMLYPPSEETK